jgi:hypothetical protein
MHGILTQIHRTSAHNPQNDAILSYSLERSVRFEAGSDRVIVINQGSKGWSAPTSSLAMVLIAAATLVGGGMTTWHYWNEEKRAAQAEQQTANQRVMDWWKTEMQRAQAERQRHGELTEVHAKATRSVSATVIPAAQVGDAATRLVMLAGAK